MHSKTWLLTSPEPSGPLRPVMGLLYLFKTWLTLNKVIIKCTVRHIVHLRCTLSLSLVRMKVRDSDVLACMRGQQKMCQVLGAFGLLDFTMLRPVLAWRTFWNLRTDPLMFQFFFSGRGKPQIIETTDTESVDMGARLYSHFHQQNFNT
jgi:hypothetical protein